MMRSHVHRFVILSLAVILPTVSPAQELLPGGDLEVPRVGLVLSFNINETAGLAVFGSVAGKGFDPLVTVTLVGGKIRPIPVQTSVALFATAISPDGETLAVDSANVVRLLNIKSGETLKKIVVPGALPVKSLRFSPSGKQLAIGILTDRGKPKDLNLWEISKDTLKLSVAAHSVEPDSGRIGVLDCDFLSEDELVTSGTDDKILLWNLKTGQSVREFKGHEGSVECIRGWDGGRKLASGAWSDGTVRVWDVPTGKELWRSHLTDEGAVYVSTARSDSRDVIATCDTQGIISIFDGRDGKRLKTIDTGILHLHNLEFSQSGDVLYVAKMPEKAPVHLQWWKTADLLKQGK